jgi:hypothetical protein
MRKISFQGLIIKTVDPDPQLCIVDNCILCLFSFSDISFAYILEPEERRAVVMQSRTEIIHLWDVILSFFQL